VDKGDCWRMARPMCRLCYTFEESSNIRSAII
jgi:hypothetical protein